MRIAYLHTHPSYQEINDLITDITSDTKSTHIQAFEIDYIDFKIYSVDKLIKLRKILKRNNIEIIHTYHYVDAYYVLLAAFGMNVKVVFSCYFNTNNLRGLSKRIFRKVISEVDAVILQTEKQKNEFDLDKNNDSLKYFKLYHAFSSKRLDNYKYESIRDEFFIDDYRYLIGNLVNYSPEHDVMNILKMVKRLRKSGRNFTCLILGAVNDKNDSYYNECKYYFLIQGLENYVTYVGNKKDHANYLAQLDAFVYHSDEEVIALPVIEAMMMGVNVIANDSEMIKEITHDGKYATLYKTNDSVDFAEKTRNVLIELDDYKIISETVKEECRNIYSIERHIAGLEKIYKTIY